MEQRLHRGDPFRRLDWRFVAKVEILTRIQESFHGLPGLDASYSGRDPSKSPGKLPGRLLLTREEVTLNVAKKTRPFTEKVTRLNRDVTWVSTREVACYPSGKHFRIPGRALSWLPSKRVTKWTLQSRHHPGFTREKL